MFQFQIGTIKSLPIIEIGLILQSFNSKLVRLKDAGGILSKIGKLFQFQIGTIKRLPPTPLR